MFFPDLVQSVKPSDRVLEITSGGTPHPRADVLLQKGPQDKSSGGHLRMSQTGGALANGDKPSYTYQDDSFPFADREFDYVICSHILQRVDDVNAFVGELTRVAGRGYLEFPTVYYEFLYDFPEHSTLVFRHEGTIHWLPKSETCLPAFRPVTAFFYQSLAAGHKSLVDSLKEWMFHGFEWEGTISTQRTHSLYDVCYPLNTLEISRFQSGKGRRRWLPWPSRKRTAA